MRPSDLKASSFDRYPPQAREIAVSRLGLLQSMPLALLPILLRELIAYDWKLPAERRELDKQFTYLASLPGDRSTAVLGGFAALSLPTNLAGLDWVNQPGGFMETLTAWLWSAHQMDHFRALADAFATGVSALYPSLEPSRPRLAVVVIGAGSQPNKHPLFRKLRPHGIYLTGVDPRDGMAQIVAEATRRSHATNAAGASENFLHWNIDGGSSDPIPGLINISYPALERSRGLLLQRIQQAISNGSMGPEELRSLLARLKPSDIGLGAGKGADTANDIVDHFQMSLMTEGAGTQIFATTFVQWGARECIRRAQPETLIVRYAPRQQAQTMNLMLTGAVPQGVDADGSLVDADMGAFYAWLGMRRLTGGDQLRFLAWFEGHEQAIAIGPGLPQGTVSDSKLGLKQILKMLS